MTKLNLGSGFNKLSGWLNFDNNKNTRPDIFRDIRRGIPFSNNTVIEVLAEHFLEHFEGEDLVFIFNEVHRVLIPYGKFEFAVPWAQNSHIDPTHKQHFQPYSFSFFYVPDANSVGAGVQGWFKPIKLVLKDQEFRWVFEKVPDTELIEYLKRHQVEDNAFDFKWEKIDLRTKKDE